MRAYFVFLSAALACGLMSACSGTSSKPAAKNKTVACTIPAQQSSIQARCPSSQCLVALGISNQSLVQAETEAKRRIAEQIQSAMRSVVETRRKSVEISGKESLTSQFLAVTQSSSEFTHAHLIRVETARACRTSKGEYMVAASLRRDEVAQVLREEAARLTPTLVTAQEKILQARHVLSFYGAGSANQQEFVRMLSLATQYRAVTGQELPGFSDIDARQTRLAEYRTSLVLSSRVETRILAPEGMKRDAGTFKAALSENLGKRGVLVGDAGDCPTCVIASVNVRADLDPNFRFGPRCELSWDIEAVDPSGTQSLPVGRGRIAAYSNRGDMGDAISRAWRRMADSAVVSAGANLAQMLGR